MCWHVEHGASLPVDLGARSRTSEMRASSLARSVSSGQRATLDCLPQEKAIQRGETDEHVDDAAERRHGPKDGRNQIEVGGADETPVQAAHHQKNAGDAARSANVRVVAVSIIYVEDASGVREEMRALRDQLPADVPLIAGGAGAMTMEKELAAMNIRVRSSISGFLSELRRDTIAS